MSNFVEYKDKVAFHPGYYIEEIVADSGLTQQDFANRLDTTPKNLSKLISGQQNLSVDMATKLSRMLGTSLEYWLNLQNVYDAVLVDIRMEEQLKKEVAVLKLIGYSYFCDNFHLPDLKGDLAGQVGEVRSFLEVASLTVLSKKDLTVSFRSAATSMDEKMIVKSNTLVQIAVNEARKIDAPRFDRERFDVAIDSALRQMAKREELYPPIRDIFLEAGVILVIPPNLKGSKINGATKRIGSSIMLMINDCKLNDNTFWFTLLHEAGHIVNGDFGISFENERGESEAAADKYAKDRLASCAW